MYVHIYSYTISLCIYFKIMKNAVSLSPSNHQHWNALGVIASHSLVAQWSLAQHAFIKSLHVEPNVSMTSSL